MLFDEAALIAARAVAASAPNMTTTIFHARITSLVVRMKVNDYRAMTVDAWRELLEKPPIIITIASGDAFDG